MRRMAPLFNLLTSGVDVLDKIFYNVCIFHEEFDS